MVCEIFFPRQLEFWACPHVFDQLDGFVRHAWFALSVFSHDGKFLLEAVFWGYPTILGQLDCRLFGDGKFLLEAVGILSLSNYSWTFGLQIVLLGTYGMHCEHFPRGSWNFVLVHMFLINWMVLLGTHGLHCLSSLVMENSCLRQLEFWACPHVFDQLDGFVRHAWFALNVLSRDGKFLLVAVFWGYRTILGQLDCRLLSLVMEKSCSRQLEFWACPTILGQLDCRLFR